MKLATKIKILNSLGLFNWFRYLKYKFDNSSLKKKKFFRQFISKGDLCFDIGSNIGEKVDLFLRLGAKVIAVEPQKDCFKFLQSLYQRNRGVTTLKCALDEKPGEKTLYICEANALSSMSENWIEESKKVTALSDLSWNNSIKVPTSTLDDLIQQYGKPKFCKIDVEGFELSVLKGLTKPIEYISFEIANRSFDDILKCIDYLPSIGSVEFRHCPYEMYQFSNQEWMKADKFKPYLRGLDEHLITGDIYGRFTK